LEFAASHADARMRPDATRAAAEKLRRAVYCEPQRFAAESSGRDTPHERYDAHLHAAELDVGKIVAPISRRSNWLRRGLFLIAKHFCCTGDRSLRSCNESCPRSTTGSIIRSEWL
jgi:hypothetical protein